MTITVSPGNENGNGNGNEGEPLIIRTSEQGWLAKYAKACKNRTACLLIDDAEIGIDPRTQTMLQMGKQAKLSRREWTAVLIALGMSGVGIWLVLVAIAAPEPTSKLGFLLLGGVVCITTGGLLAIRILTRMRPPNITLTKEGSKIGFKIEWTD